MILDCTCRYGDIFKTNILGCPCVMISSPEAARIVLVTHAHLFKPIYPPSKEKLIGPEAVFFQQGAYHSMLKSLVQASFLPSTIKHSISEVKRIVIKMVPTWTNKTINTLQEMKKVICRSKLSELTISYHIKSTLLSRLHGGNLNNMHELAYKF